MKPLKPSMREKKRYILLKGRNLKQNVRSAIFDGIGILGMSKAGFSWVKEDVIAVNRQSLNEVRACFAIFPEKIRVLRVSGSLKKLKETRK